MDMDMSHPAASSSAAGGVQPADPGLGAGAGSPTATAKGSGKRRRSGASGAAGAGAAAAAEAGGGGDGGTEEDAVAGPGPGAAADAELEQMLQVSPGPRWEGGGCLGGGGSKAGRSAPSPRIFGSGGPNRLPGRREPPPAVTSRVASRLSCHPFCMSPRTLPPPSRIPPPPRPSLPAMPCCCPAAALPCVLYRAVRAYLRPYGDAGLCAG